MTFRGRIASALLLALLVEAGNLLLIGMVFDPGPLIAELFHRGIERVSAGISEQV